MAPWANGGTGPSEVANACASACCLEKKPAASFGISSAAASNWRMAARQVSAPERRDSSAASATPVIGSMVVLALMLHRLPQA